MAFFGQICVGGRQAWVHLGLGLQLDARNQHVDVCMYWAPHLHKASFHSRHEQPKTTSFGLLLRFDARFFVLCDGQRLVVSSHARPLDVVRAAVIPRWADSTTR